MEKLKQNKKPLSTAGSMEAVRSMSDGQSGGWQRIYGWKDLWKRCVLSLEWKRVVVMEQVCRGERNGRRRKENGQDAADGMKPEVYSKDGMMCIGNSDL